MKKLLKIFLFASLIAGCIAIISSINFSSKASAAQFGIITKMNVSTGVTASTSSAKLLEASSGRVYAVFVNDGAVPVYLSMDGNAAVAAKGVRLNANGGSYEINSLNQYVGVVNVITGSSTSNVTVSASQ